MPDDLTEIFENHFAEATPCNQSELIRRYAPAIALFNDKKREYDRWYMSRSGVSIAMMLEREELFKRYDFAIKTLQEASGA